MNKQSHYKYNAYDQDQEFDIKGCRNLFFTIILSAVVGVTLLILITWLANL